MGLQYAVSHRAAKIPGFQEFDQNSIPFWKNNDESDFNHWT